MKINDEITNEEMKEYMRSDEFLVSLDKASSSRTNIFQESSNKKDFKDDFIEFMMNGLDKNNNIDQKEYKKKFGKTFNKLVDFVHYTGGWPKDDSPAKIDVLADVVEIAVKYFNFMGNDIFNKALAKRSIYIDFNKTQKLDEEYTNIKPGTSDSMKALIEGGKTCQSTICNESDNINKEIYQNEIPSELQYSKENKTGIKASTFNKLATIKAMKERKSEEKLEEYMDNLTENSLFKMAGEELIQEGIEQLK